MRKEGERERKLCTDNQLCLCVWIGWGGWGWSKKEIKKREHKIKEMLGSPDYWRGDGGRGVEGSCRGGGGEGLWVQRGGMGERGRDSICALRLEGTKEKNMQFDAHKILWYGEWEGVGRAGENLCSVVLSRICRTCAGGGGGVVWCGSEGGGRKLRGEGLGEGRGWGGVGCSDLLRLLSPVTIISPPPFFAVPRYFVHTLRLAEAWETGEGQG